MSVESPSIQKRSFFERFIRGVEVIGNKLPHPFWLFCLFSVLVIFLSFILSKGGVSVSYVMAKAGETPQNVTVAVQNLLSYESMRDFLANFVKTYVNFAPLGLVLTMMLGIGIVEQTGMISALMRKSILGAPSYLITAALAFVGINANLASDAGIIFTPVIGAAVYKALGKNPWIGIIVGYAAAAGGFTANFFIAGTDALLAGITGAAMQGSSIQAPINPLMNWYFMLFSTITLTLATVWVTEKFTNKMLQSDTVEIDTEELKKHQLTPEENRGLRFALFATLAYVAVILLLTLPNGSFFRADDGGILPKSPLLASVMPILFGLFFTMGTAYGCGCGYIKKSADIPNIMAKGLLGNVSFMVVVLPASMFVALFSMSRLDTVLSVSGAEWLQAIQLPNTLLILLFILLVSFLNLFMMSGSAKWLILAPIFVPMFAQVGLSPALTQVAYRVGDSSTNIISPVSYYLPVIIGLLEQYKRDDRPVGIGTVISLAMPYSLTYLVVFSVQLVVWYVINWPLGPGALPGL